MTKTKLSAIPSSRKSEFSLPGRPKKSLGQHFLVNPRILERIVETAEIKKDEIVLEVGPGTGNLTEKLAEKAKRVIAIEKDEGLAAELKEFFKGNKDIEIIEGDALKIGIEKLKIKSGDYKIVANIPYYITSRFLKTVFEKWPKPKLVVLTIQKEVAQRIMAKPPKMNLLAVSVQFYAKPEIVGYVSKVNFRPAPKIDSAIIKMTPHAQTPDRKQSIIFFKLVKAGFSGKRKILINNLQKTLGLEKTLFLLKKARIRPELRAEELDIQDWLRILKNL